MNLVSKKVNIWDYLGRAEVICVTTNGVIKSDGTLVMGAGIAKQAAIRFPELPRLWAKHVQAVGNFPCFSFMKEGTVIASFPTKHHWKDDSSLELIETSARGLVSYANQSGKTKILLPPPGCGHGRLDWETQVKPLLSDILDERFWVLHA